MTRVLVCRAYCAKSAGVLGHKNARISRAWPLERLGRVVTTQIVQCAYHACALCTSGAMMAMVRACVVIAGYNARFHPEAKTRRRAAKTTQHQGTILVLTLIRVTLSFACPPTPQPTQSRASTQVRAACGEGLSSIDLPAAVGDDTSATA